LKRGIRISSILIILIIYSCESNEYDFLFFHNHTQQLEITNNYGDGILWVDGIDEVVSELTGRISYPVQFRRFDDTLNYLDHKTLPVEPGLFSIFLTGYDSTIYVDTFIVEVKWTDKHTEIMLDSLISDTLLSYPFYTY